MLVDFYKLHARLINATIIFIILALVGWLIYYFVFTFHITSITPEPSRASYLTPKLEVTFNRDLVTEGLKVEGEGIEITSRVSGKNKLEINITSNRKIGTVYKIKIVSLKSTGGDEIRNHTINLAALSSEASLTDSDRKIILDEQQDNKPQVLNDPISYLIPYSTLQFSIEPTGQVDSKNKIVIKIIIFLSNADVKINRQAAIDSATLSALNYLKNGASLEAKEPQGVNPDNYTIKYEIREP
jgi:hypothetical protein